MRVDRALYLTACVLGGAALYASPALADWHSPYFHRETHDEWTNVEYNDGVCHYKYSHNAEDGETHVNRWGDCSRVAIGPNGDVIPIAAPVDTMPVPDDED